MLDIYTLAGRSTGYWAGYFLRTVRTRGGLATARLLLEEKGTSTGFERLKEEGRLDLSMEALVLRAEFRPLFTPAEISKAVERLAAHGYGPAEVGDDVGVPGEPTPDSELEALLARIDAASPADRMDHRDAVVALGPAGREAMRRWLAEEHLPAFAISVLEKLARSDRVAGRAIELYAMRGGRDQKLASAALDRLERR